jgi:hypothetical protein
MHTAFESDKHILHIATKNRAIRVREHMHINNTYFNPETIIESDTGVSEP